MLDKKSHIINTMAAITVITVLSKVFGFLRETVVAYVYGVGAVTDAYAVAARVMGSAGLIVGTYLSSIFVPSYARVREEQGEDKALGFTNDTTGVALAVNLLLMVVLQVMAPLVLKVTGFDAEQSSMALMSIRMLLLQLPMNVFIGIFSGYLTARKSFLAPNLVGFPISLVVILTCLVMGTENGITGLTLANMLGAASQLIIYFFFLPKEKYRYRFSLKFNSPEIRRSAALLIPALLGSAIHDLNIWVDTIIATHLGEGSAAAIGFASRMINFVQGIVVIPLAGITFSYMSEYAAKKETEKMLKALWRTIRLTLFVVIPIAVIAIPSSRDIVRLVYQRGQFTPEDTLMTSSVLTWYLPLIIGIAAQYFIVRLFYAMENTKAPMLCGALAVGINIILSIILSRVMGIEGVALATSIGSSVAPLALLLVLKKKLGRLAFAKTAKDVAKMAICAVPCFLVVLTVRHALSGQSSLIRFAACAVAGGIAYLISAFLLKEAALIEAFDILRGLIAKAKKPHA